MNSKKLELIFEFALCLGLLNYSRKVSIFLFEKALQRPLLQNRLHLYKVAAYAWASIRGDFLYCLALNVNGNLLEIISCFLTAPIKHSLTNG